MPSEAKWVPMRGGCHVRMTVPSCGGAVKYVQMTGEVSRTICGPLMRYSTACSGRSCGRTGNRYEETRWTWASCAVSLRLAILSSNSHSCWRGRTHKVVRHLRAGVTAAGIVGLVHAVHDKQGDATTVRAIRMIRFCGWQSRMRETLETGVGCRRVRAHRDFQRQVCTGHEPFLDKTTGHLLKVIATMARSLYIRTS
jgi:hypothetical protein